MLAVAEDPDTLDPHWPWTFDPHELTMTITDGPWSAGTMMACGFTIHGQGASSTDGSMERYQTALLHHEQGCAVCLAAKRLGHDRGHA